MNKQPLLILCAVALTASGCAQSTSTPTPELTETATVRASNTPPPATRTPTLEPAPERPNLTVESSASLSPNGEWIFVSTNIWAQDVGQVQFQRKVIQAADPSLQWLLVDEWSGAGLGMSFPEIVAWSADGQFVYLAEVGQPDGCGLPFASGLRRVNLTDGQARVIGRSASWPFALAPDGKTMAAGDLQLLNLEDGTERAVELALANDEAVLATYWSPDSGSLLVLIADTQGDVCDFAEWPYSLVSVNAETLAVKTLIEKDAGRFTVAEWTQPNRALLQDKDGGRWWLDVADGTLTPAP